MDDDRQADAREHVERAQVAGTEPGWALRAVMRAYTELNQALARRLGLGASDLAALDLLFEEGPLGPVELGRRLGMRSASATALVDRLEAAGHVRRQPHPTDRRRLVVEPTRHAADEILAALGPLFDDLNLAGDELGPDGREAVVGYLRRVTTILRTHGSAR